MFVWALECMLAVGCGEKNVNKFILGKFVTPKFARHSFFAILTGTRNFQYNF